MELGRILSAFILEKSEKRPMELRLRNGKSGAEKLAETRISALVWLCDTQPGEELAKVKGVGYENSWRFKVCTPRQQQRDANSKAGGQHIEEGYRLRPGLNRGKSRFRGAVVRASRSSELALSCGSEYALLADCARPGPARVGRRCSH